MVSEIESRMRELAARAADHFGYDRSDVPGAGAAGGLCYAFMQFLGAECHSGIDLLLEYLHFDGLILGADCVITGEGSADEQTLMGKLPYGIMIRARSAGVPTWLVPVGSKRGISCWLPASIVSPVSIHPGLRRRWRRDRKWLGQI